MRKFFQSFVSAILVLLLCGMLLPLTALAETAPGGYIVLPDNADDKLTAAADTLAKYMEQITGNVYPIADEGAGLRFELAYTDEAADNGYIIETAENAAVIKGSGTRGLIHGVYAFLEKYCDCDWYTRDFVSVPQNENLTITAGEPIVYEPFFEYTDTDWYSGDLEYSLANGLTGGVYRDIPVELGGEVSYLGQFCHTLTTTFCKAEQYFNTNPEYFALHQGVRTPDQLCLTNEKVYEIVRDEVLALLAEQHNPDEYLQIVSLTQHDNSNMCQCESCKAIDDANGSHAGTMITFVNKIAKDVKAAGYDNVAIDTFAYQYTRQAPTQVVPDDNVIVRLCTIECCFAHALDDPNCPENVKLMEDLTNWGKICNRIYVWDYTTNYANTVGIFPDFGVLQRNIQVFLENNVKGIYEEGNYYIGNCDAEFGDLRCYLLAKLMQNPYIDYTAAMEEFNNAFYGTAGEYLTEFINMTTEKPISDGEHLTIYVKMLNTLGFGKADIAAADALWESAKQAVADDETLLQRVRRSELCWRYWKANNVFNLSELKSLQADLKAFGIGQLYEGASAASLDAMPGTILSDIMEQTLEPFSIVLYAIAFILTLAITIVALKTKPRKWHYPVTFLLAIVYFEIFAWHRRAYLAWVDIAHWALTLVAIIVFFAMLGAQSMHSRKKCIIMAIVSAAVALLLYEIGTFGVNNLIFDGTANVLGIGIAYTLLGIFGVVLQSISLKNMIEETKASKEF